MRWLRARQEGTAAQVDPVEDHRRRVASPRAIWLPQQAEPVTVVRAGGEKLPGRVYERSGERLLVAIVVPTPRLPERELAMLVVEYANPGGRVRLRGDVSQEQGEEGLLLRIEQPQLIDVVQERRHVRVAAECPLALHAADGAEPILTHTLDVSAGGLLLAPTEGVEAESEFDFKLAITPGTAPITGGLQIVRVDAGGRAGVHFTAISHADRWRLIRFSVECQSQQHFRHPALDADEETHGRLWAEEDR